MHQQEGVIKYQLRFTQTPPLPEHTIRELNAWRKILYLTRLIGQRPDRYEGYGYGNISQRWAPYDAPVHWRWFAISASQTGGLSDLTGAHYTLVKACYPAQNRVVAEGPLLPSSECMTHAMLYHLDDGLRFVMHAHSPEIWHNARALGLSSTCEEVAYGTPEMAQEVARLFRETDVRSRQLFAMGGHEDGVIAFGCTADEAGRVLLQHLARALQL